MQNLSLLQLIEQPLFKKHQLEVKIKRDDLIHPIISGNKWRKLKYNLIHAKQRGFKGILSFGGSYSNHIHALAFACKQQGLASLGIIRGEPQYSSNFTLTCVQQWGMKIHFVDRKTYRLRNNQDYLAELQQQYPDYFIVPEGGSNALALNGVAEVIDELNQQADFDTLMLPVGSGGTFAGLINADKCNHKLLGIAVLKQSQTNRNYLTNEIKRLLPQAATHFRNWQVINDFHRGGYAKFSTDDCQRIQDFNAATSLTFEPVYSGKMLLAFLDLIEQGYFAAKQKIVLLHTGGLQGIGGLLEQNRLNKEDWKMPKIE